MLLGVEDGRGYFLGCVAERQGATVTSHTSESSAPPWSDQWVRLPWRSGTPHTRHPGGQGVLVHDLVHREERGSKTGPVYAQCTQHTKAGLKRRLLGESERRFAGAPSAPLAGIAFSDSTGKTNRLFIFCSSKEVLW